MTKLWIFSDLHAEQSLWTLPQPPHGTDVIVAAGDIDSPCTRSVERLAELADGRPVVFVPGNHEWYATRGHFGVDQEATRARLVAANLGVHMLMDDEIEIAGIRFLGATLWTDFAIHGTPSASMSVAAGRMNDFRYIYPIEGGPSLTAENTVRWHVTSRSWLADRLAEPCHLPTVVVTHHLPHPRSVATMYRVDPLTPAFASDFSGLVEGGGAALWIHGHTHTGCDYQACNTRVVCNPQGYGPKRKGGSVENPAFDPTLVITI
ncbi:metallophosphoesterase [Sphingomonas arantia]|uniref:Metallophosphoesterase n=1 Tax=Sphingomonas arantia TaxID=1460676 RepID=A0ABW4TZW8_9SPHN